MTAIDWVLLSYLSVYVIIQLGIVGTGPLKILSNFCGEDTND